MENNIEEKKFLEDKFISKGHVMANIAFILADVLEMFMFEVGDILKREKRGLRQEVKYRYNELQGALKMFRRSFISKTDINIQECYGQDSDIIFNMMKLIIDRCGSDINISKEIFDYIEKTYPSKFDLDIDKDCYNN